MDEAGRLVDGLDLAVDWVDYDAGKWREHPDPGGGEFEDDDDGPWPEDVKAILGFDPAAIEGMEVKGGPDSGAPE